jgi:large subunit ribosomal protein L25
MAETLQVKKRKDTGKLNNRRLRREGHLPAILYGHGEEAVMLTLPAEQLEATLRHGAKVVDLAGDASGQALLQDIHWDTFQKHVLHIDLLRVDASERVTVEVPLQLRGEAPGEHEGGIVEHLIHYVEIETSPVNIPEALHIKINKLALHGTLTLADIVDMPEGATLITDAKSIAVQCVEPAAEEDEDALAAAGVAEPEVIGRKADDESEGDED